MPKPFTTIGKNAFSEANKLETITFAEGSQLTSIGEHAFDTCSALKSIALPDGFKTIGEAAFADCKALKTVEAGNSLEEISTEAFKRSGLESINLPATLKTIGKDAFYECNSLQSNKCFRNRSIHKRRRRSFIRQRQNSLSLPCCKDNNRIHCSRFGRSNRRQGILRKHKNYRTQHR